MIPLETEQTTRKRGGERRSEEETKELVWTRSGELAGEGAQAIYKQRDP